MVKKLKVVDVVEDEEAKQVAEPIQEIVEVEQPTPEDVKPIEELVEADKSPILEEAVNPTTQSKQLEYITCDTCNKQMLMKTFKYSHKKM